MTPPLEIVSLTRVRDLPCPDAWQSSARLVQNIKRSIQRRGYVPADSDDPITVLHEPGGQPRLINGNHRTEALGRARLWDLEVPVLHTAVRPAWLSR